MNAFLQAYRRQITERPYRTFAIQTGLTFTLGDIISQQLIEKRGHEHDYTRTMRMLIYGAAINGPLVGSWFGFLNRTIVVQSKIKAGLQRLAMDQIIFTPFINGMFLTGISVLERRSWEQLQEKFKKNYTSVLKNAYSFWPFVNLIQFSVIPPHYRTLTNCFFALSWNTYLSYFNHKSIQRMKTLQNRPDHTVDPLLQSSPSSL